MTLTLFASSTQLMFGLVLALRRARGIPFLGEATGVFFDCEVQ